MMLAFPFDQISATRKRRKKSNRIDSCADTSLALHPSRSQLLNWNVACHGRRRNESKFLEFSVKWIGFWILVILLFDFVERLKSNTNVKDFIAQSSHSRVEKSPFFWRCLLMRKRLYRFSNHSHGKCTTFHFNCIVHTSAQYGDRNDTRMSFETATKSTSRRPKNCGNATKNRQNASVATYFGEDAAQIQLWASTAM